MMRITIKKIIKSFGLKIGDVAEVMGISKAELLTMLKDEYNLRIEKREQIQDAVKELVEEQRAIQDGLFYAILRTPIKC